MRKSLMLSLMLATTALHASNLSEIQERTLNLDWLDTHSAPNKDFYQFANGSWKLNNPIPKEYSSWGSFSLLQQKNLEAIHGMLEKLSEKSELKSGTVEQKIADFYFSGMNVSFINSQGIQPLTAYLDQVTAIDSFSELQQAIVTMHHYGIDAVFGFGSMQDFKDSTKMIGILAQSGLSLPDRDYYFAQEDKFKRIREAFLKHMAAMFQLAGDSPSSAAQKASIVMRIETELAGASMTQIAQRNPQSIYHMLTLEELEKLSPNFDWVSYFKATNPNLQAQINVGMPDFFRTFDRMLTTVSLSDWKVYLRWHWIAAMASYLSDSFVQETFNMSKIITGAQSLPPRWKQVIGTESSLLGFGVGEVYVKQHFSAASRQQIMDMIAQIRKVLRSDLADLQWMTEKTRQAALKKLDLMEERVGFPDKWWDYSSLKIDRGSYVSNVLRATAFLVKRDLNKIGKPIDRTEWAMTPQTVNAYYDPSMNNINIPMGILQPPYFDKNAPLAVNYGAIGVVIGHEITHGFDDQGAKFDGYGNLNNWWTPDDL